MVLMLLPEGGSAVRKEVFASKAPSFRRKHML